MLSHRFGPEHFILVVEKSTQTLLVYSNYEDQPTDRFTITTGRKEGQKVEEGDMKTPEGIYYARRILAGEELPKVEDYGEKAFTLNYPNPMDHLESRSGSGIWLHGAYDNNKIGAPNNSRGCIVMHNGDLLKISKYIYLNKTPICIYDKITYDSAENLEKRREHCISIIKKWKSAWEEKDIDGYIGFFHDRYVSSGMDLAQFRAYKENLNQSYKFIRVFLSDVTLYGYKGYFVVRFNQLYLSDRNMFYNNKIQYWSEIAGSGRLVDEITFPLPAIDRFEFTEGNTQTVAQYRRDLLRKKEATASRTDMQSVALSSLIQEPGSVVLNLARVGGVRSEKIRVIPVLRMQSEGTSWFTSLEGVNLKDGVPQEFSRAVPLSQDRASLTIKKEKEGVLQSLTLFMVNDQDKFSQIVTYFVH